MHHQDPMATAAAEAKAGVVRACRYLIPIFLVVVLALKPSIFDRLTSIDVAGAVRMIGHEFAALPWIDPGFSLSVLHSFLLAGFGLRKLFGWTPTAFFRAFREESSRMNSKTSVLLSMPLAWDFLLLPLAFLLGFEPRRRAPVQEQRKVEPVVDVNGMIAELRGQVLKWINGIQNRVTKVEEEKNEAIRVAVLEGLAGVGVLDGGEDLDYRVRAARLRRMNEMILDHLKKGRSLLIDGPAPLAGDFEAWVSRTNELLAMGEGNVLSKDELREMIIAHGPRSI